MKYQLQYDPAPPETCPHCGQPIQKKPKDTGCLILGTLFALSILAISCLALAGWKL